MAVIGKTYQRGLAKVEISTWHGLVIEVISLLELSILDIVIISITSGTVAQQYVKVLDFKLFLMILCSLELRDNKIDK